MGDRKKLRSAAYNSSGFKRHPSGVVGSGRLYQFLIRIYSLSRKLYATQVRND